VNKRARSGVQPPPLPSRISAGLADHRPPRAPAQALK
jgi:hypothetical protein